MISQRSVRWEWEIGMMYIVKMFTVVNINKILSQVLWFNPTNNAKWTIISFKWQNWRKTIQVLCL